MKVLSEFDGGSLRKIVVAVADDSHAPDIQKLCEDKGFKYDGWTCDWSKIGDNWLIAIHEGEVISCMQVLPGLPFGRIEYLLFKPGTPAFQRLWCMMTLLSCAEVMLRSMGCQAFQCMIADDDGPLWKEALEDRGFIPLMRGFITMKVVGHGQW